MNKIINNNKKEKTMRHFEYKDLTTNSYKFWDIKVISKEVVVSYGRIGIENPAVNTKKFSSKEEAKKYFEKKIKEKTSKGYVEH
jgi:predicted DNA-binding WGR domain protein|tara:strand:+ start:2199 stop:2450 length:252 start_codon:yes stop_codon:yes gene_type:complete